MANASRPLTVLIPDTDMEFRAWHVFNAFGTQKRVDNMQFIMQAPQPAPQFLAHGGIERAKRLVKQQHPWLHRQSARQRDPLALSARQLRRIAISQPVQLYKCEQLLYFVAYLLLAGAALAWPHAQAKGDVLEHAHVLEQGIVLEHETNLAFAYLASGGIGAIQKDQAAIGRFQARDDAQQRCLSAAGRPQQSGQFALRERQRHVVEGDKGAKPFMDIAYFNTHAASSSGSCA